MSDVTAINRNISIQRESGSEAIRELIFAVVIIIELIETSEVELIFQRVCVVAKERSSV